MSEAGKKLVLIVEDSEDDRILIRRCLGSVGSDFSIRFFENGPQAIEFLTSLESREPVPAIIILDIKLAGISGFEILHWIRSQPDFVAIPIAMLSSSILDSDQRKAAQLGANAYHVKSNNMRDLQSSLKEILKLCKG
jgi:CheY-like chemotaxis protein